MTNADILETFSSYAILIPISAAIFSYQTIKNKKEYLYFFLFLIWGFIVDVPRLYMSDGFFKTTIYNIYAPSEIIFYLWFCFRLTGKHALKTGYKISTLFVIIYWLACMGLFHIGKYSLWFDAVTAMLLSFFTAYEILLLTQKSSNVMLLPQFWVFAGVFFYFFCNTVPFLFIEEEQIEDFWWLHNSINIFAYGVYTYSFLLFSKIKSTLANSNS